MHESPFANSNFQISPLLYSITVRAIRLCSALVRSNHLLHLLGRPQGLYKLRYPS